LCRDAAVACATGSVGFESGVLEATLYEKREADFGQKLVANQWTHCDAAGVSLDLLTLRRRDADADVQQLSAELQALELLERIADQLGAELKP